MTDEDYHRKYLVDTVEIDPFDPQNLIEDIESTSEIINYLRNYLSDTKEN